MRNKSMAPFWYLMALFLVYKPLTKIVDKILDYKSAEIINWVLLAMIITWGLLLLYKSEKFKDKKKVVIIYLLIFGVYGICSLLFL